MPAQQNPEQWADCNDLRTKFTSAMSAMYRKEVPLYGNLIQIVDSINSSIRTGTIDEQVMSMRFGDASQPRLDIERHGAIRVGTAQELRTLSAVFRLLGLSPVGYYDLSHPEAGLPMHATCFRPASREALRENPFRVFTSVLRPNLIKNPEARKLAVEVLARRSIFSPKLLELLKESECQGGKLPGDKGDVFVEEALKTFQWNGNTTTTREEYEMLRSEHPVLADITCFPSCHINHLTPRTLDITAAQIAMEQEGLQVKDHIEGPPPRQCPILLRQTSFLAVEEVIKFLEQVEHTNRDELSKTWTGSHRARFGEIEERGAAVTPAGRQLYDKLTMRARQLQEVEATSGGDDQDQGSARKTYDANLAAVFEEFPDEWNQLRQQRLVYFTYQPTSDDAVVSEGTGSSAWPTVSLDDLIEKGTLKATPVTYEDFLPLSAAGIFRSNLGTSPSSPSKHDDGEGMGPAGHQDVKGLEEAIGCRILSSDDMYRVMEENSIEACSQALKIKIVVR